jgi:hypothetical protein
MKKARDLCREYDSLFRNAGLIQPHEYAGDIIGKSIFCVLSSGDVKFFIGKVTAVAVLRSDDKLLPPAIRLSFAPLSGDTTANVFILFDTDGIGLELHHGGEEVEVIEMAVQ